MRRARGTSAALVALAWALVAATGSRARADPVSLHGGFATLGGRAQRCLDVRANALVAGSVIDSSRCSDTTAQQWTLVDDTIRPTAAPHLCLDVQAVDPVNGRVSLQLCDGGSRQIWRFTGGRIVWAANSAYCLDVSGNSGDDGQPVGMTTCNDTEAQDFWPYGFSVTLGDTSSGSHCLEAFAETRVVGATRAATACSGAHDEQIFTPTKYGQLSNHGLCVSTALPGDHARPPESLALKPCKPGGSPDQDWHFRLMSWEGLQVVGSPSSGGDSERCLDVVSDDRGTNVRTSPCEDEKTRTQAWLPSLVTTASPARTVPPWVVTVLALALASIAPVVPLLLRHLPRRLRRAGGASAR